jgi:hypothetical protein
MSQLGLRDLDAARSMSSQVRFAPEATELFGGSEMT